VYWLWRNGGFAVGALLRPGRMPGPPAA
jgi:hypothetical protein